MAYGAESRTLATRFTKVRAPLAPFNCVALVTLICATPGVARSKANVPLMPVASVTLEICSNAGS